jgi:hypothetical protein
MMFYAARGFLGCDRAIEILHAGEFQVPHVYMILRLS